MSNKPSILHTKRSGRKRSTKAIPLRFARRISAQKEFCKKYPSIGGQRYPLAYKAVFGKEYIEA